MYELHYLVLVFSAYNQGSENYERNPVFISQRLNKQGFQTEAEFEANILKIIGRSHIERM